MLVIVCIGVSSDSLSQQAEPEKEYTGQLLVSGFMSIGFGVSAAIFHTQSRHAYEDYQNSTTIAQALERWDAVRKYDLYRNVCIAGSVLFLARFMYYHIKQDNEPTSTGFFPRMDVEYTNAPKISIGLQRFL
jgi:hypothetical protein